LLPQVPHQFAADKTTAAGNKYEFVELDFVGHDQALFDLRRGDRCGRFGPLRPVFAKVDKVYDIGEIRGRQHSPAVDNKHSAIRAPEYLLWNIFEGWPRRRDD
jgi:hypothetical protein